MQISVALTPPTNSIPRQYCLLRPAKPWS